MDRKGFGLVEVLVSMTVLLIILGITYTSFNSLLKGFKRESKSIETQVEKSSALELVRLDIEHAGYGISANCSDKIMELNGTTSFIIRSTLNNTNEKTRGWVIRNCLTNSTVVDKREDTSNDDLVYLTLANKTFVANSDISSCPGSDVYIAFPYDSSGDGCESDPQFCTKITYSLSSNQPLSKCHPGTYNLLRSVNSAAGTPILNCVADVALRFDLDTNNDGIVDVTSASSLPSTNSALRSQLKNVKVYLLVQEGQEDKKYTFSGSTTIDGVTLSRPSNSDHYRWKIIKLSIKPLNL